MESLFKYMTATHKKPKSHLAKYLIDYVDDLFMNLIMTQMEPDAFAQKVEASHDLLFVILDNIFKESQRYISILMNQKGVNWAIYAQNRSKTEFMVEKNSIDEIPLLDEEEVY